MHTTPDTLALMALGEEAGTAEDAVHLAQCPVCRAQIEELAHVVHLGRQPDLAGELQRPPAVVWERIRAEIKAERMPAKAPAPRTIRRSIVALAAAFALIAGVGLGIGVPRLLPTPATDLAVHLNALPQYPGSEGQAEVVTNAQGGRELVVRIEPAQAVKGHLDVWLSDEKAIHMQRMGTLTGDAGTFAVPASMDLHDFPVIDVSLEAANDPDPLRHSGTSLVRGRLRT